MFKLVDPVVEIFRWYFPELSEKKDFVKNVIIGEENKF